MRACGLTSLPVTLETNKHKKRSVSPWPDLVSSRGILQCPPKVYSQVYFFKKRLAWDRSGAREGEPWKVASLLLAVPGADVPGLPVPCFSVSPHSCRLLCCPSCDNLLCRPCGTDGDGGGRAEQAMWRPMSPCSGSGCWTDGAVANSPSASVSTSTRRSCATCTSASSSATTATSRTCSRPW